MPLLLTRPVAAIGISLALVVALLAARSPAYPVAFAGLPPIVLAITGSDPLPPGTTIAAVTAAVIAGILAAILLRGEAPPLLSILSLPGIATALLLVLLIVRLPASADLDVGSEKVQLFIVGNVLFLLAGVFVGWRLRHIRTLLAVTLAVAVAAAAVVVLQLLTGTAQTVLPDRFSVSAEYGPIALGRTSATGLVIAAYFVLSRSGGVVRLVAAGTIPVLVVALLGSGSRGPVVALTFGLAVLLILGIAGGAARRPLLLIAASALAAVALVPQLLPNSVVSRAFSFATEDATLASNGRFTEWDTAYENFVRDPWTGVGTGEYAGLRGDELYPHNVFLEAAVELGIPGLLLVLVIVAGAAYQLARVWRATVGEERLVAAAVLALFVTALANALFSGAMPHNLALWLWAGVGAGFAARTVPSTTSLRRRVSVPTRSQPLRGS